MSKKEKYEKKKYQEVLGKKMAYIEEGQGQPIVLLHGNPTSSYLWRNVIPELKGLGRVIAPDLIGHGNSDKLSMTDDDITYSFKTHYKFLETFLESVNATKEVIFVVHDWGSALGFHWSYNHPNDVNAIAYMEGIVCPIESWDDWPEAARGIFQGFRSSKGENLILDRNLFVEGILPNSIIRELNLDEMSSYRTPFLTREDRQPTLDWPRQIPIAGEPIEMVELVNKYANWLNKNNLPKLFINAEPGSILTGKPREFCRRWLNQKEITVKGLHFIQEDSPQEIGSAIRSWIVNLRQSKLR